jgi:hypothetical protein
VTETIRDRSRAERFQVALDELRSRGMVKRFLYQKSTGKVCAIGALFLAHGQLPGSFHHTKEIEADLTVLRMCTPGGGMIQSFNDAPLTTQEMVEQIYEKAIARVQEWSDA